MTWHFSAMQKQFSLVTAHAATHPHATHGGRRNCLLVVFHFVFVLNSFKKKKAFHFTGKPFSKYEIAFPVTRMRSTSCCSSLRLYGKVGCSSLYYATNICCFYNTVQIICENKSQTNF
jgi:hypothetical protein